MVGLPAQGKGAYARKVTRFVCWLGIPCTLFSLAQARALKLGPVPPEFHRASNEQKSDVVSSLLSDVAAHLGAARASGKPCVVVYDACNVTRAGRASLQERLCGEALAGDRVMFIEMAPSEYEDRHKLPDYLSSSVDYAGLAPEEAAKRFADFLRVFRQDYEPLEPTDMYVRVQGAGTARPIVTSNLIRGWLPQKVAAFVASLRGTAPPRVWMSRHGQSRYNLAQLIGGDSRLTPHGEEYGEALARWAAAEWPQRDVAVWCSTLVRTRQTAAPLERAGFKVRYHTALEEIGVGLCDGMTYEDVAADFPHVAAGRKRDKFAYRYPYGESYSDLVERLAPLISAMERAASPLLVIAHQAVLRVLFAYMLERRPEDCTHMDVPLHCVFRFTPLPYGAHCKEEVRLMEAPPTADT